MRWKAIQNKGKPSFTWFSFLEQATGIEPATTAWEAVVLPLNYACACELCVQIEGDGIKTRDLIYYSVSVCVCQEKFWEIYAAVCFIRPPRVV